MLRELFRKLFLVREISTRDGKTVHFRRYRLLDTKYLKVYIHQILKADGDRDPHTHPWDFTSMLLRGSYTAEMSDSNGRLCERDFGQFSITRYNAQDPHRIIKLDGPVWSMVVCGQRKSYDWGYWTDYGYLDHKTYRRVKDDLNAAHDAGHELTKEELDKLIGDSNGNKDSLPE